MKIFAHLQKLPYFCAMKETYSARSVISLIIFIAAYAFLIWKVATFKDYDSIKQTFLEATYKEYLAFFVCVCLMPVNLLLEAKRWQQTIFPIERQNIKASFLQVLGGMAGAFITPYRAGEIPARVAMMTDTGNAAKAIFLGLYSGLILTFTIVLCGLIPSVIFLSDRQLWIVITYSAAALILTVAFYFGIRHYSKEHKGLDIQTKQIGIYSFLRYLCFSVQMYLMLIALGIDFTLYQALISIPVYYLLVTVSPNMPVLDLGVRGSWAIFVFSRYCTAEPLLAIVAGSLWVVNTLLPLLLCLPFVVTAHKRR